VDLLLVRLGVRAYIIDSLSGRKRYRPVLAAYSALIAQRFAQLPGSPHFTIRSTKGIAGTLTWSGSVEYKATHTSVRCNRLLADDQEAPYGTRPLAARHKSQSHAPEHNLEARAEWADASPPLLAGMSRKILQTAHF
jgi:hypothetical protein